MKPIVLDLFCGAGGATKGYQLAGFQVIGIDHHPQPNYCGETFWQADALDHLSEALDKFYPFNYVDAIHASPPCQAYSALGGEGHERLIEATRNLLVQTEIPWVIENIEDAKGELIDPVMICGTMFDPPLDVKRHRYFETNWNLEPPMWPCRHKLSEPRFDVYEHGQWRKRRFVPVYGTGGGKAKEHWNEAMSIDWMTQAELAQAIPPAYTELIGSQLLAYLSYLEDPYISEESA